MSGFDSAVEAAEFLRGRGFGGADVAVVLGSGLGAFADTLGERFEMRVRRHSALAGIRYRRARGPAGRRHV